MKLVLDPEYLESYGMLDLYALRAESFALQQTELLYFLSQLQLALKAVWLFQDHRVPFQSSLLLASANSIAVLSSRRISVPEMMQGQEAPRITMLGCVASPIASCCAFTANAYPSVKDFVFFGSMLFSFRGRLLSL